MARIIDEDILGVEEDLLPSEGCPAGKILWDDCNHLEIVDTVGSEMNRLADPTACGDNASCRCDQDELVKKALALAYELLKLKMQDMLLWQGLDKFALKFDADLCVSETEDRGLEKEFSVFLEADSRENQCTSMSIV